MPDFYFHFKWLPSPDSEFLDSTRMISSEQILFS